MEIVEGGIMMKKRNKRSKLLAVEDYLDFFDNRTTALNFTVNHLHQIIGMHGFKKIATQKSNLIDMVSTMELIDLCRSTLLNGSVSGDACLSLEEVIHDLNNLDWKECHVTSLLTQGVEVSATSAATSYGDVSVTQKKSKRPKTQRLIEIEIHPSVISPVTAVATGSTTESLRST